MDHYFTINKTVTGELKERGSTFIAYAFPINTADDFKRHLKSLKKTHPKAVHHCFAYRIGLDGNNFRISDDGEPSGTAGKTILARIDSKALTNILVVVVRYFGGTLLGLPGLINAYGTAATLALQLTPIIEKQVEIIYTLTYPYTSMNEVMLIIKRFNCTVMHQEIQLFCKAVIGVPKKDLADVMNTFNELRDVEVETVNGD